MSKKKTKNTQAKKAQKKQKREQYKKEKGFDLRVKREIDKYFGLTIVMRDKNPLDITAEGKSKIERWLEHTNHNFSALEISKMYNSAHDALWIDENVTWARTIKLTYDDHEVLREGAKTASLQQYFTDTDMLLPSLRASVALEHPKAVLKQVDISYKMLSLKRLAREYEAVA